MSFLCFSREQSHAKNVYHFFALYIVYSIFRVVINQVQMATIGIYKEILMQQ